MLMLKIKKLPLREEWDKNAVPSLVVGMGKGYFSLSQIHYEEEFLTVFFNTAFLERLILPCLSISVTFTRI